VTGVAFRRSSHQFYTASADRCVKVGRCVQCARDACVSGVGRRRASHRRDVVRPSGTCASDCVDGQSTIAHDEYAGVVLITCDGQERCLSVGADSTLRVWKVRGVRLPAGALT
jgi:hypothetical protein